MTAADPTPPRIPHDPSQLAPGDCWAYRCHLCRRLRLQGGWPGVLAHFRIVHPDRPIPDQPPPDPEPEPTHPRLEAVRPPARPETPTKTRKRATRAHSPAQDTLFDLEPPQ